MDLKEHLKSESTAFAERLASLLNERVEAVRADLEREHARAASLEADLDNVIAAHREVEQDRARAEQDRARAEQDLAALAEERGRLQQEHAALEQQHARLQQEHERLGEESARLADETERLEQDARRLDEELHRTRELLERARAEAGRLHDALEGETAQMALAREELEAAQATIARLESEAAAAREHLRDVEQQAAQASARMAELEASETVLRDQLAAAHAAQETAERDAAASADHTAARCAHLETQVSDLTDAVARAHAEGARLLEQSVAAVDALNQASTVDALLHELTVRAAVHAPRVVVFRAKGNHLEGERGIGVDSTVDVTKLMIPTGVDSLLARAVSAGSIVRATREQLAAAPPPLGGAAAAALAIPIALHDQLIAVLYADSPEDITDAEATAALLLTRHAAAALSRLARELKTLEELREYAVMLVDEVAQIYNADVEAGCSEPERLRRVRGSIDYARELYAHRAAIEGPSAATLFEKHLASVREQDSLFSQALAMLDQHESHRNAS